MADRRGEDATPVESETPSPFERFQSLTKRLLHVSKDDLREAEAREQEKRRTA
jgi:hypothetical protein